MFSSLCHPRACVRVRACWSVLLGSLIRRVERPDRTTSENSFQLSPCLSRLLFSKRSEFHTRVGCSSGHRVQWLQNCASVTQRWWPQESNVDISSSCTASASGQSLRTQQLRHPSLQIAARVQVTGGAITHCPTSCCDCNTAQPLWTSSLATHPLHARTCTLPRQRCPTIHRDVRG
jgi:hypothetical protein